MTTSFDLLGLNEKLVAALKSEGLTEPTAIQERTIPLILENKDVVGQSETGTGKTFAYLLPLFQKIDTQKREVQALILTPTHELAIQVQRQIDTLIKSSGLAVTATALIGNVNITRQIEKLKEKPHILVGSSGRILELIQKRKITAPTIKTIVLDEADRLLDDMNSQSIKAVIKTTLKERQLLLFSATVSTTTLERAAEFLKNPEIIRVTEKVAVAPAIMHMFFTVEQRDKVETLRKLVRIINPTRALVFINKSEDIETTVEKLKYHGLEAVGIHGSAFKGDRRKAMEDFRTGKIRLLVASDLAARGLDIKGVTHIFNLDTPEDPQLYLHRVGRTGRAGEAGTAISIVSASELPLLRKVETTYKITISLKDMFKGKIVDPRKMRTENMRKPSPSMSTKGNRRVEGELQPKANATPKTEQRIKSKPTPSVNSNLNANTKPSTSTNANIKANTLFNAKLETKTNPKRNTNTNSKAKTKSKTKTKTRTK